jgi:hypothetical protein
LPGLLCNSVVAHWILDIVLVGFVLL